MPKQWTVLVYMGADDKPGSRLPASGLESLRQMCRVGSSRDVDIVAQADITGQPTRLYYFTRGAALEDCVLNPSNLYNWDSGEPQVLEQFVRWGMSAYPARRYLLILWGHGTGLDEACYWEPPYYVAKVPEHTLASVTRLGHVREHESKGLFDEVSFVLPDYTSYSSLRNQQLGLVLKKIREERGAKLALLGIDACVMSMAEVWYEMRDGVSMGVGSENTMPLSSWPYERILGKLVALPRIDQRRLARNIVREFKDYYQQPSHDRAVTLSACDLSQADDLANATAKLTEALLAGLPDRIMRHTILAARIKAQHFYVPDYMDLGSFCELLGEMLPHDTPLSRACADTRRVIQRQFIKQAAATGKRLRESEGVSIYFPRWIAAPDRTSGKIRDAIAGLATNYAQLHFIRKTRWNEFLLHMLEAFDKEHNSAVVENQMPRKRRNGGNVKLPDGTMKLPDGTMKLPDGTIKLPDGTIKLPDGTMKLPDGTIKLPDGTIKLPDGTMKLPDGTIKLPDGTIKLPNGAVVVEAGGGSIKLRLEIDLPLRFVNTTGDKSKG